ncbi:ankyrin repeat-containing domain protein [Pyrenochaeta sp. MPI-SDFR-AT-0127]|nr:ankyrin repeat-containing domain protein [Pyrenochaeta sp. MPI-SDFR-AT-0127]
MGIVQCIHSNIWRVFSVSPVASVLHAVLARQSLTLIQQELPKLDIEDLEEDPSIWFETIPSDVQYAISHWATHIKLSMEVSDELLNLVVTTFSRNSLTIDKWFIIYLYMNYNISQQDTGEHHHTTVLHLFAFFNLHELLQKTFDSPLWGRLDKYVTTLDALQNDPLALALSQNYTETARLLLSTEVRINLSHVIRAAHSSKEIAEDIFSLYERDNENGHEPISRATMAAILDGAVINGGEEIVACTVAFLKRTASGDAIPSHDTDALKYVIETGQHHLLALLLPIVDLESTAVELICAATSCHGELILADLLLVPQIWHAVSEDKTALLYCLNLSLQHKCPVMVERLITNDNMHQSDEEGQTPLWIAVNHLNVQTLRCFLRRKDFFFNRKSIEEGVALNFLLHKDKTEAPVHLMNLKKILERGARMQYKHFGITSFHVAAELGRPEVMKVLLEYMSAKEIEVDIDQKPSAIHGPEKDYLTALMIAALKGHGEIVKLLLAAGADTKATDRQGKTAMMLASEAGHREIQEILGKVTSKQREVSTELEIGNTMEEEEPKKEPKKGRKRKGKRK